MSVMRPLVERGPLGAHWPEMNLRGFHAEGIVETGVVGGEGEHYALRSHKSCLTYIIDWLFMTLWLLSRTC